RTSSSWLTFTSSTPPSNTAARLSPERSATTRTSFVRRSLARRRYVSAGTTGGTVPVNTHVPVSIASTRVALYSASRSWRVRPAVGTSTTTLRSPLRRSWTYAPFTVSTSTARNASPSRSIKGVSTAPVSPPRAAHSVTDAPSDRIMRPTQTPCPPACTWTSGSSPTDSTVTVTTGPGAKTQAQSSAMPVGYPLSRPIPRPSHVGPGGAEPRG